MALHIDRVNTEMEVVPSGESGGTTRGDFSGSDSTLLERLRPIVLEILEEELQRLRREAG
jgi:hypothetical protein